MNRRKLLRIVFWIIGLVAAGLSILLLCAFLLLKKSLPDRHGEHRLRNLSSSVKVEFDEWGVPTIHAQSRADAARGLGYLHGQERFFQMDLMRKMAAGELASLLGPLLKDHDVAQRLFDTRAMARESFRQLPQEDRELLEAYSEGVNAGLAALGTRPFEYWLTFTDPASWLPEDSLVAGYAMYYDLQDERADRDLDQYRLAHSVSPAVYAFFSQFGGEWQAALDGSLFEEVPIPEEAHWDYLQNVSPSPAPVAPTVPVGSNAWAVSGTRTADGRAILANDMHLNLSVPNTWYKARLIYPHPRSGLPHSVTGLTLPGVPFIVTGTNGSIAWGFTNSYLDTQNLVAIEEVEGGKTYQTREGPRPYKERDETIRIRFGNDIRRTYRESIWGPVRREPGIETPLAVNWVGAHAPLDGDLLRLEASLSIEEALEAAVGASLPAQNIVIAGRSGRIAWTIAGDLPEVHANDGANPMRSAQLPAQPPSTLAPDYKPVVLDAESGYIWTANSRTIGGELFARLGDAGSAGDARARQIRDRLMARDEWDEEATLALQLDDEAWFLHRWRDVLLDLLAGKQDPALIELRSHVEAWDGYAKASSVGQRVVAHFRDDCVWKIAGRLLAPVSNQFPGFNAGSLRLEQPIYQIVRDRPAYLADPEVGSIETELLLIARRLHSELTGSNKLSEATWGEYNQLNMKHPISHLFPILSPLLDMPHYPLDGTTTAPRVTAPSFGASGRMVVSPGREEEGFFHMPGGQSGHPLSPNYRDMMRAWVDGTSIPLLPGAPQSTMILLPDDA